MIKLNEIIKDPQLEFPFMKKFPKPTSCQQKFGKELFGDFYSYLDGKPHEKDTYKEKSFFNNLVDWIKNGRYSDNVDSFIVAVKEMYRCKKEYKNELDPIADEYIFRATYFPVDDLLKLKWTFNGDMYETMSTYKAQSEIQSWAYNITSAYNFIRHEGADDIINGIVEIKSSGEKLLFNSDFMNLVDDKYAELGEENEILRIGNSPKKCFVYLDEDEYKKMEKYRD